jgi:hypothetical protein
MSGKPAKIYAEEIAPADSRLGPLRQIDKSLLLRLREALAAQF